MKGCVFIKRIIIILSILITFTCVCKEYNNNIIPNDAIRIRVIANSNNINDQVIKIKIKDQIQKELYNKLSNINSIGEARLKINKEIPNIKSLLQKELNNTSYSYSVKYGKNFFPQKDYKGIKYNEGNYESLVVTLGKGTGNNWWCVLFPPLCLLDIEEKESNNVEYKSKVLEILQKYN